MRQKLAVNAYLLDKERLKGRFIWVSVSSSSCISYCASMVLWLVEMLWWHPGISIWAQNTLLHTAPHWNSTPHLLPLPIAAAVPWNTNIVPGTVCSYWCLSYLISLVTTDQSSSLSRILYLSTHPNSQRIFLCFCAKVTPVDSITFLITIIHFQ